MPRFTKVRAVNVGQSQALMSVTGGGETVEPTLAATTAWADFAADLAGLMPGVTVATGSKYAASVPVFTEMFDNGTGVLTGDPGFWNITGGAYEAHGTDLRNALLSGADPAGLCMMLHYFHSQDLSSQLYSDTLFRTGMAALYAKLNADVAGGWGEFRILPMLVSHRPNSTDDKLRYARRMWATMAGRDDLASVARLPYVMAPITCTGVIPVGAYTGGGDVTHVTRASAKRFFRLAAQRVAGQNGIKVPVPDQPRIYRAVKTGAATCDAYVALPARRKLGMQLAGGFSAVTAGGSVTVGAVDNSKAATHGYAKLPLTLAAPIQPGERLRYRTGYGSASFAGALPSNVVMNFEDLSPGGALVITDAAEDVAGASLLAVSLAQEDRGIIIEGA